MSTPAEIIQRKVGSNPDYTYGYSERRDAFTVHFIEAVNTDQDIDSSFFNAIKETVLRETETNSVKIKEGEYFVYFKVRV